MAPPATPASRIIGRFGVKNISAWTRRDRSRVHAWTWPRSRGGTGGVIPHAVRPAIIRGAQTDFGEALAYADFEPMPGEAYLAEPAPTHVRVAEDCQ